jgi:type IV pilus assembly protein PilA
MQATLRRMRAERAAGDRGFTLIELLVVVVIIGVLVAIAIPVYLNYRKGAENKSAQSDVRNAVTAVEQFYAENGNAYPKSGSNSGSPGTAVIFGTTTTGTAGTGGTPETANVSAGNTLVFTYSAGPPASYTIAVTNADTGKTYTYDSTTGKIT